MKNRVPSLNSLRYFEAAARNLSFSKAADELHVSHGAVSKQIRKLEEDIGVQLFQRKHRSVFLTNDGQRLLTTCQAMMEQLKEAIQDISGELKAPLVISCEPTITMKWLIPNIEKFQQNNPDIEMHIYSAGGPVDFKKTHIDLALRRDDFHIPEDLYCESIGDEIIGPVCSRKYIKNNSNNLFDIALHTKTRQSAWQRWASITDSDVYSRKNLDYEHFYLSLQAALSGHGIAIGSAYMVFQDIVEERLRAPSGFVNDGTSYVLLSETPFDQDNRKQVFLDWIRSEFEKTALAVQDMYQ
jgi:LysR family glycine cleavage system transcriptional activator